MSHEPSDPDRIVCAVGRSQQATTDAILADAQLKAAVITAAAEAAIDEALEKLHSEHPAIAARVVARLKELPAVPPFFGPLPNALPAAEAKTVSSEPAKRPRGRPRKETTNTSVNGTDKTQTRSKT